jgi:serine/threonine-protein kinase
MAATVSHDALVGRTVGGCYDIVAFIDAGGMGDVYKAHDKKLDRPVALKLLPSAVASDPDRLRRFKSEARAASSLNHPYILVIHDFGDLDGRPFIVSEYVEGQTLRRRLDSGPVPISQAVEIATELASAIAAAHARGIIHRDIKPENIMLRPDGFVKMLDFGLAKLVDVQATDTMTAIGLTQPGVVVGTPRYMSPEQVRGMPLDARSDVWSLGVVLYEMLAGRCPFDGLSAADVMAAVLRADPPAIDETVVSANAALKGVVRTALASDPRERFRSAREMQEALIATARDANAHVEAVVAGFKPAKQTHLIVLPFRSLRPDADTDFLSYSLPDAVSASLANIGSLVVRSSIAASHVAADADPRAIALQQRVDMIVVGTLLRLGNQLRVSTQLIDAAGTLVWSHTDDVTLGDLFQLQDALVEGIVSSLALPLTGRERRLLRHDVPASPVAYEYFLRANELSVQSKEWRVARGLYQRALDEDPRFAPAWAGLARICRLLGKYQRDDSEDNLRRAENALGKSLQLNPELSAAHRLLAQLDVDRGYAEEAMVRLVVRARDHGGDAELFAALVHVCRFCGLMDASIAADAQARSFDPTIDTGVMHTYWLMHRYEDAVAMGRLKAYVVPACLVELGRPDEARAMIAELERSGNRVPALAAAVRAFLDGRHAEGVNELESAATIPDPEMFLYVGRHLAHVGEPARALGFLQRGFEAGHYCYPVLASDGWLDGLRADPVFQRLLDASRNRWAHASAMFAAAGGPTLLGSN